MPALKTCATVVLGLCLILPFALADENESAGKPVRKINWMKGPMHASLGNVAEIEVPEGFILANPADTRKILESMDNPTSGSELGFMMPTNSNWFVVFSFDATGYIKDDDKDKLDADKILKSITAATEEANKIRAKNGGSPLKITGWEQPPKYNAETHNLEWAIRGESDGKPIINYNTRLLGRKGVMEVQLVVDPAQLAETMPAYQTTLKDYSFKSGERYAEYRQGDKIAKYGLAALITGGAAVVAVKSGLLSILLIALKKLWIFIVAGFAAVGRFFKRIFGGKKTPPPSGGLAPPP